jgi:hypothetical protein
MGNAQRRIQEDVKVMGIEYKNKIREPIELYLGPADGEITTIDYPSTCPNSKSDYFFVEMGTIEYRYVRTDRKNKRGYAMFKLESAKR